MSGKKHYLVTGGAGFIGSHLADALLAAGHHVTILDDLSTGYEHNIAPAANFICGDAGDTALLNVIIPQVHGVFHLAAVASVQKTKQEWAKSSAVNQFTTIRLLEAIKNRQQHVQSGGEIPNQAPVLPPCPLVFASSAAVYGDPDASYLPITEDTPISPLTPYGVDKYGSEMHLRVARDLFAIPTLACRFFNVYGPRQDPSSPYSGVISIFADRIARGEAITYFGDGRQTRDFIHVADVVAHLLAAMNALHDTPLRIIPDALNICTGHATTLIALAETLSAITGNPLSAAHAEPRPGDIIHSCGNPARAIDFLKIHATIALKDGLKTLLN